MKRLLSTLAISACTLFAQRADTIYFRATMLPSNEVPAVSINASGAATITAHVMRNATGQIVSGTVDFSINYTFPGEMEFTGLHIHRGAAGVNGPVTINTGLSGTNSIKDATGRGAINRPAQVRPDDEAALATLRDMVDNPAGFYVNLHSTVNPGGVIRAQLKRADVIQLLTELSPRNEVPAITGQVASGACAITVLRSFDEGGKMDAAQVIFRANYAFDRQVTLTGFHIHNGPAGVNAGVVVNTGLANLPSSQNGVGTLVYPVDVDVTREANVNVINGLFDDPGSFYANIHTSEFTGGIIRGQLRRTDDMVYAMTMLPSNEVPPVDINASGAAFVRVNSLRNAAGQVTQALVTFDVNYRFPAAVTFTGLHIHNQVAGQNGSVVINTGLSGTNTVVSENGFGNIALPVLVTDAAGLATVNSMTSTPEAHYINLHSTVNAGGVVRAQIAPAHATRPAIGAATSGAGPVNKSVAPGGVMSIFGERFAYSSTDYLALGGGSLPATLNGVSVTIGGREAPILRVAPWQVDVQVPYETAAGNQPVVVKNAVGESASLIADVQRLAPAVFAHGNGEFAVAARTNATLTTFGFITEAAPAEAGDIVVVLATGLGPLTPAVPTGRYNPELVLPTGPVSATIGGRPALVLLSGAYPGAPGYNVVGMVVAPGTPSGSQNLVLSSGGQSSVPAKLWVK
ncbi:MAG: CHRD domain-containing protein [Acidobacteria bacterium]|nr:CHRD domain-containing protein [Acidobacteriota bacterium]